MGRGKIEIRRIENSSNRQVTYSKRRNGIIKKAKEITVLCDAKVSLIIFATSGKMVDFCSPSTSLADILEQYHRHSGKRLWDPKHEEKRKPKTPHLLSDLNLNNEIERIKKENDSLQIKLRHLKAQDITHLNYKELMGLEDALENGLAGVRDKLSEKMEKMRKNGKLLEEEHHYLTFVLREQEMAMARQQQQQELVMDQRVVADHRHVHVHDYTNNHNSQSRMPFAFTVQPTQPDGQDL